MWTTVSWCIFCRCLSGRRSVCRQELVRRQIRQLQGQKESLDRQVAEQTQVNADLAAGVEDPDDPDRVAAIARDKLGLAVPNEKIFVITN